MQQNQYVIGQLKIKIDAIQAKAEKTPSDESTLLGMQRYHDWLKSVNYCVARGDEYKCFNSGKPPAYYKGGPYIAHCLVKGTRESWNGVLSRLGYQPPQRQNKNKKRPRNKKNAKRKVRKHKKKVKQANKRKKQLTFTIEKPKPSAKFARKYNKIKQIKIGKKTYGPRLGAITKNLDLCSRVFDAEEDERKDTIYVMSTVANSMKINIGAVYIDQSREEPTGHVSREEMKTILPVIWGGAWQISKPVINYVSSYFILLPDEDNTNDFEIDKYFTEYILEWTDYEKNRFHPILKANIDEMEQWDTDSVSESENESESDSDSESENLYSDSENGNNHEKKNKNNNKNSNKNNNKEDEELEEEEEEEFNVLQLWLAEYELDEKHVINKLINRKRPVKLHELAALSDEDLGGYLKETIGLDAISIVRFQKMMVNYKHQAKGIFQIK